MNHRNIVVFDFETDGIDPHVTEPVELAAVVIEPRNLNILYDDSFNCIIRPENIDQEDYYRSNEKTIQWHASNHRCESSEILDRWKRGLAQKVVWKEFNKFCKKHTVKKRAGCWYPEPIIAGYNIINFDLIIAKRLSDKYKVKEEFSRHNKIDLMDWIFTWFENLNEPRDLKMDTLREFLGMSTEGGHEALVDVHQTAEIIVKFLQFQRKQASVDKFKGAFNVCCA
jgi:exonuclease I